MNNLYIQFKQYLKNIWTKYSVYIIGFIVIILAPGLIYFIDKPNKQYKIEQAKIAIEFEEYKVKYAKAIETIKLQEFKIDSLNNVKQQILIKHEKVISDFSNPFIISNDSITKYISSKIYNKR